MEFKDLKKAIWAYFLLLIFEGALRKWVLPGLANPLLLIRDPIAIWIIFTAWNRKLFVVPNFMVVSAGIGVLGIFTSVLFGHGSWAVALFGARALLIHFPLIFVIGPLLDRGDIIKIGKVLLYLSILMAVVMGLQFYSPQSAWINRGVGGDTEGAGFSGAMGFYRPSGTFSFTNGISLFFSLSACFIFYFWLKRTTISRFLLICATIALVAAIPLSISRGLFFTIGVTVVFIVFSLTTNLQLLKKLVPAALALVLMLIILSQVSVFETAINAFTARFENASASEGGLEGTLVDRYLGGMTKSLSDDGERPFFGYGLGSLSNVGTMLLSGRIVKGVSEGEWGRLIFEMGFALGMVVIILRMAFSLDVLITSYRRLHSGDLLPWILLSIFLLNIPQGNWAQPTSLGFTAMIGGLLLAALNSKPDS